LTCIHWTGITHSGGRSPERLKLIGPAFWLSGRQPCSSPGSLAAKKAEARMSWYPDLSTQTMVAAGVHVRYGLFSEPFALSLTVQ
jgi:hypothetical protein